MSHEFRNRRHVADVLYDAASRITTRQYPESPFDSLPALSLYAFVTSLMALGRRVLQIGKFELGIAQVLSWQRPALTLTALCVYTKLCYCPQWLLILPLAYFIFAVLVPNYAKKFWIDDVNLEKRIDPVLPVMSAQDPDDKKQNSRTMLKTIKQGQKGLTDLVALLDKVDSFLQGPARFADAPVSSLLLVLACAVLVIGAYLLTYVSIPLILSLSGWYLVFSKHPLMKLTTQKLEKIKFESQLSFASIYQFLHTFAQHHVLFDELPLKRRVEIYELQPQGLTPRQWNNLGSIYSATPYLLNSASRLNLEPPNGCSAICEVIPPNEWYFALSEDWTDDKNAAEWVSLNEVTTVEPVGAWAYDIPHEGVMWRRRRWTRFCYHDAR